MKFFLAATTGALLCSMSAFAADLPARKSPIAVPSVAVSSWTGVYGGLNVGYAFGGKSRFVKSDGSVEDFNRIDGGLAGAQIGFDYQAGNFVGGVAADLNNSWVSRSRLNDTATLNVKFAQSYVGTLRTRIGYSVTSSSLVYGTAGAAFANSSVETTNLITSVRQAQTRPINGYVLGAGFEHKYTGNVSSFIEYRYYNFTSTNFAMFDRKGDRNNSEVRTGVNYRF